MSNVKMKLIEEAFKDLRLFNRGQMVLLGALTPQLIQSLMRNEKELPIGPQNADLEFGWSGLQICSTNLVAYEYLKGYKRKTTGFMLEGAGYLSISGELFEGFQPGVKWPGLSEEDSGHLTQLVSMLVSDQMRPEDREGTACIVQFTESALGFPSTHLGLGVHVMLEVSEDAWTNLYQVHAMEIQAATEWYKKTKGAEAPKIISKGDLSAGRSLN